MHGWDYQGGERAGAGGKGTWLKLANDGDKVVVVFLGEPKDREVVFDGARYAAFTDAHKQQGIQPKVRMAVNVGVLASKEVKVWDMGYGTFRDIVALRNKFGLADWAFEICRSGMPKDPKTKYQILPERQLNADEKAWMASAPLVDLARLYADDGPVEDGALAQLVGRLGREGQQKFFQRFGVRALSEISADLMPKAVAFARELARAPAGAAGATPASAPAVTLIDDAAVAALVADLRRLPSEHVTEWLKHVGVQRVRELPLDRLGPGKEFLAMLMKEFGPAPVVDPLA